MVAAVAMAGCASEPEAAPSPEPSASQSSPSPSETTETPSPTESEEPYAVPDDIDEAYVQAVVDRLDRTWADMLQVIRDERSFQGEQAVELTLALMTGPEAARFVESNASVYEEDPGEWEFVRDPVGPPNTVVEDVPRSGPSCIVAAVDRGYDDVYVDAEPVGDLQGWLVLERLPEEGPQVEYAAEHNPTGWLIAKEVYTSDTNPDETWCA